MSADHLAGQYLSDFVTLFVTRNLEVPFGLGSTNEKLWSVSKFFPEKNLKNFRKFHHKIQKTKKKLKIFELFGVKILEPTLF